MHYIMIYRNEDGQCRSRLSNANPPTGWHKEYLRGNETDIEILKLDLDILPTLRELIEFGSQSAREAVESLIKLGYTAGKGELASR